MSCIQCSECGFVRLADLLELLDVAPRRRKVNFGHLERRPNIQRISVVSYQDPHLVILP